MAGDWRQWRGFALEEAELLGGRLKHLMSSGQAFVQSRLGWDLGLEPELYPTWLVLTTAALGALLLLATFWAAFCGGGNDRRRKRSVPQPQPQTTTPPPPGSIRSGQLAVKTPLIKRAKPEETKRKNVKKVGDKKPQPNGESASAVVVQQEVKVPKVLPRPPPVKTRKAAKPKEPLPVQVKKEKKSKANVKAAVAAVITLDVKESDEGTWETKVSNREKKQQRRKDKGPETLAVPEDANAAKGHVKKKSTEAHESQPSKSVVKAPPPARLGEGVDGRRDFSDKTPTSAETVKWGSRQRGRGEPGIQESQGGSQTWLANGKSDPDAVSYSALRANPADGVDLGSDWSAPAEHWGNYEGPTLTSQLMEKPPVAKVVSVKKDDQNLEGGAAISKKKRKKKKKNEEEAVSEAVNPAPKLEVVPTVATQKSSTSSSRQRPEQNATGGTAKKEKKKVKKET
ncbi:protein LYRIC-like [Stigmatopora nigra]